MLNVFKKHIDMKIAPCVVMLMQSFIHIAPGYIQEYIHTNPKIIIVRCSCKHDYLCII